MTLQQTVGLWGSMTPMPDEIGAGHQLTGLRSWCQTCCAPFETRGQMRACQSASENLTDLCPTLDFSSACIYQQHTSFNFTFKDCQPLSSMTLEHYGNEPGHVCKVGILSQSLFIYSGQWAVICMHSNMHISVFFRESLHCQTLSSSLLFLFVIMV